MKCNLIIPGFPKCGSTSLCHYLDHHSDIHMSIKKEPHYFSRDSVYERGSSWHDQLFDNSNRKAHIFGEASTSYAYDEKALSRIKSDLPNVKLILILRDPVERLLSHYKWLRSLGYENKTLKDALNEERSNEYSAEVYDRGTYKTYLRASSYSKYVPYILDEFGIDRVRLIRSEDLLRTPLKVINDCYSFLGVSPMHQMHEIKANMTSDQKKQNYWGLDKVSGIFPKKLKGKFVTSAYLKLLKMLGKSSVGKIIIDPEDVIMVQELLKADTAYYKELFECA